MKFRPNPGNPELKVRFQFGIILCMGSMLHQAQQFGNQRSQAAIAQSIRLHTWGNVVLALLLPWVWQRREAVVGCCVWDITGFSVCTAPQLLWYPGTRQPWAAAAGCRYSLCAAQWGETEEKSCCFMGGLSYPHHQLEMSESGGRVTKPDSAGTHTQDNEGAGPRPLQLQMPSFHSQPPTHARLETNP